MTTIEFGDFTFELVDDSQYEQIETQCDGKSCGTGKRTNNRKWLCSHNNFKTLYPSVAMEWHPTKNGSMKPEDFSPGSNFQAWWLCTKCLSGDESCHSWQTTIWSRVKNKGCPYCSKAHPKHCKHYNFGTIHPKIAKQWHPFLNGVLKPEDLSPKSSQRVWWFCDKCPSGEIFCHAWQTSIGSRTANDNGCPFCSSGSKCQICEHSTFEALFHDVAKTWHPTLNGDKKPEHFGKGSGEKIWWQCPLVPNHIWRTPIYDRIRSGCKLCSSSTGERLCQNVFIKHNIDFLREYSIQSLSGRRYDFMITVNDVKYVIEYDGAQHFYKIDYFHGASEFKSFDACRQIDIDKTEAAIREGYRIIRLDHQQSSFEKVEFHILRALELQLTEYYSDPDLYKFIIHRTIRSQF